MSKNRWGFMVLASLVATLMAGVAIADPVGHFLVGRATGSRDMKVWNPTAYEFFAIAFAFEATDDFDGCESTIVPSKGTDYNDILDDWTDQEYFEVLAVPTEGGAGKIRDGEGVGARFNKAFRAVAQAPGKFKLPTDSATRDAMVECACDELDDAALPSSLLKKFGIKC